MSNTTGDKVSGGPSIRTDGATVYFSGTGLQWTLMPYGPPGYSGPLDGTEFALPKSGDAYSVVTNEGFCLYLWYDTSTTCWHLIFCDDINIFRGSVSGVMASPTEGTMAFEGGNATIDVGPIILPADPVTAQLKKT